MAEVVCSPVQDLFSGTAGVRQASFMFCSATLHFHGNFEEALWACNVHFVLNVFLGPCVYGCGVVYAGMGRKRKSGQESFAESVLCDLDCPKQGIVTKTMTALYGDTYNSQLRVFLF